MTFCIWGKNPKEIYRKMRINEYNTLDEFIDEYYKGSEMPWQSSDGKRDIWELSFLIEVFITECVESLGTMMKCQDYRTVK